MVRKAKPAAVKDSSGAVTGYEAELWKAANALRGSMDAGEYKHVVLGLIFLKFISDAFGETHAILERERAQNADSEDRDEYTARNVFWVPPETRWPQLAAQARQPTIGRAVDDAMAAIERDNPVLGNVLPKDYARQALDKQRLCQLVDPGLATRMPAPAMCWGGSTNTSCRSSPVPKARRVGSSTRPAVS